MKVGDKVKVKSFKEIKNSLNGYNECTIPCKDGRYIYFDPDMEKFCGMDGKIKAIDEVTGCIQIAFDNSLINWGWSPCWLIPVELSSDTENHNTKWLIFCMIFQYLSGNCPNPNIFKYFSTPTKEQGGFNFSDFGYDFLNIQKETVPFPDWPILNLPLDEAYVILEHCYKYGLFKKDLEFFTYEVSTIIFGGFCWNDTPEGDEYWNNRFAYYKGPVSKEELDALKNITTQIKTKSYENKLQRKKSIVIRGTVPEGSITCGRKRKTSIAVGHLSNSVCIGG